jgi:FRG domain
MNSSPAASPARYVQLIMTATSNSNTDTIGINSFNDYTETIAALGDAFTQNLCLFRGQLCDKPLIPKLGRLNIDNIKEFEKNIFADFQKRYLAYSSKTYTNNFDLLALGQHFGLPTRLLDWTESALVALWFATEIDITEKHSVVWIFSPEDEDILREKQTAPFSIKSSKVFSPNHISERITAQAGWFTCHKLMDTNKFLQFETLKKYKDKLIKLTIPKKLFPEIRVKLSIMGVNSATVYPDLVGLSRHLSWKHLKAERF